MIPLTSLAYDVEVDGIYYNLDEGTLSATVTSGENEYTGDVSIPSTINANDKEYTVTSIGGGAFEDCSSLSTVNIPNSVTSIGRDAFEGCTSLSTITIPNSVTRIDDDTFQDCSSLTSITIPNSVTIICSEAFFRCTSLSTITIPKYVKFIFAGAFDGCSSLSSVTCEAQTPPYCYKEGFDNIHSNATLCVYESAIEAYRTTYPWSEFAKIEPIKEAPTSVSISISNKGAATSFYNYDLDFTGMEDIKAYVASGYNYNTGSVLLTRVYEIPANTGFMVTGNEGSYSIPCAEVKYAYANLFRGTLTETDLRGSGGGYSNYVLADGDEGLMFYLIEDSKTLPANSAYLHIPTNTSSNSRTLSLSFADDSEVTGIDDVVDGGNAEQAPVYNLSGQRVSAPKNGVFVKNGKIVIIK